MKASEKRKLLIHYAQSLPINDLPGYNYVVTPESRYVRMSDNALPIVGYQTHEQAYDTDYYNMPCQASENADTFMREDKLVLETKKEIKLISYHNFDHWRVFVGQKKPIIKDDEVIGQFFNFVDVTESGLVDLGRYLLQENKALKRSQFSYIIQDDFAFEGLTEREQQCLFFYVRGCSYREIAEILNIDMTTVRTHLEHVKAKFKVNSRSQLIEKALGLGFMCVIPQSLLK